MCFKEVLQYMLVALNRRNAVNNNLAYSKMLHYSLIST